MIIRSLYVVRREEPSRLQKHRGAKIVTQKVTEAAICSVLVTFDSAFSIYVPLRAVCSDHLQLDIKLSVLIDLL